MNPYENLSSSSNENVQYDNANIVEHPRYDGILNRVLRGEEKSDIYQRMEVNSTPPKIADLIYLSAFKERVAIIKSHYTKKIIVGLSLTTLSVGIFYLFVFVGAIPHFFISLCALGLCYGVWKLVDGVTGVFSASSRKGEISHIIN